MAEMKSNALFCSLLLTPKNYESGCVLWQTESIQSARKKQVDQNFISENAELRPEEIVSNGGSLLQFLLQMYSFNGLCSGMNIHRNKNCSLYSFVKNIK